jgi:Transcriptional regulator containing an amidase domain and an AraC-type DNA-binding HTH domain
LAHSRKKQPTDFRMRNDDMSQTWIFAKENNQCMAHFHLCVEVHYILKGRVYGVIDGTHLEASAGEMIVISSYAIHHFLASEPHSQVIVAVIPMTYVPSIHSRLKNQSFKTVLWKSPCKEAAELILLLHGLSDTASQEVLQGLSQALLGILIDKLGLKAVRPSISDRNMRHILEYMQAHYTQPLTLDTLTLQFNYSRSRLSHLFQQELRLSFTAYLATLRCRHAAILLRERELTVTDIAMASGFESLRTFYRAFEKEYRQTPLQYAATAAQASL